MKRSQLERLLGVFTDVRPGEGRTALLMFLNVFLILCAYYFIKPLRDGWIATENIPGLEKMEIKAYSNFGQTLLLIPVVTLYGRLSQRWQGSALITRSTLFCMLVIFAFWMIQPGFMVDFLPGSGVAFFLWVGMFSVFVVAQFWTFTADLYTDERGRRMMPLIMIGANAGAAFGAGMVGQLVNSGAIPKPYLLLVANVPLAASIWLTQVVERRGPLGAGPQATVTEEEGSSRARGSLGTVVSDRFMLAVGVMTLLMFWVITNGENMLNRVVLEFLERDAASQGIQGEAAMRDFLNAGTTVFYGDFYLRVNLVTLLLQALVASRLLKYGGFPAILLALPVVSMLSYATMALVPLLAMVKLMKVAENSTNYSLNNTARHVLWLPATSKMIYKGKPTIDTLFVRAGDGIAALTVLIGVQFYALATEAFFMLNVALVTLWLGVAFLVIRLHRRLARRSSAHEAS